MLKTRQHPELWAVAPHTADFQKCTILGRNCFALGRKNVMHGQKHVWAEPRSKSNLAAAIKKQMGSLAYDRTCQPV